MSDSWSRRKGTPSLNDDECMYLFNMSKNYLSALRVNYTHALERRERFMERKGIVRRPELAYGGLPLRLHSPLDKIEFDDAGEAIEALYRKCEDFDNKQELRTEFRDLDIDFGNEME